MSNHFDCIGIHAPDAESYGPILDTIYSKAIDDLPRQKPYRHVRWTDQSGASVALHLRECPDGPEMECVTPFFDPAAGLSRWRVRTYAPAPDPECAHCGGADCDILDESDEMITRAAVQLLHFLPYREWLTTERKFELEIAAFAHTAAFYGSLAEFDEGQRDWWTRAEGSATTMRDGKALKFGSNAFLPEGMFASPDAPLSERAIALFAGPIQDTHRLRNSLTGGEFQHLRINPFPGILDVVLDPANAEGEPAAGKIAFVRAWLVGRPVVQPPTQGRGFWRRLLAN